MNRRKKEALEALQKLEEYRTSLRTLPDTIKSHMKEYQARESVWSDAEKALAKEKIDRYIQYFKYTRLRVRAIERALAALTDEQQMVLRYMCIERNEDSLHVLCNILSCERSCVYGKLKKAREDFETCLFGAKEE